MTNRQIAFSPGHRPAFPQPLHVGRPNIGSTAAIHRRIDEILQRRWLSNDGVMVQEFERRIAALVGVKHCMAVCNATVGLEIAYRAAGLSGEVIIPANTFVATAHALQWQGITSVFCDIDRKTHNLDPRRVEKCITPRTSGIVGVHVWGRPCDTAALEGIAKKHGLKLLFDSAHAFGCSHEGKMIGGFGTAEVFSFHATKFVNCGEGGAIVTNDDDLAARVRQLRNFGIGGCDHVVRVGTNGKMSEFAAAMGLSSLDSMDEFIQTNKRNYHAYCRMLAKIPGVNVLHYDQNQRNNFQYVVLEVDENESPLTRDQWLQVLHVENVLARRYFYPGVHRMEPYRTLDPATSSRLPVTEAVLKRVLVLPSGTAVELGDIELIGRIFTDASGAAARLQNALPRTLPLPTLPLAPLEQEAA
jgi:dTDP-4-amino-4,6-dideoxygalactose transaminase